MGKRTLDLSPHPATSWSRPAAALTAVLTAVVITVLLVYPRAASDAALSASPRAAGASAELSVPVGPGTDQRLPAAPTLQHLSPALSVREWSASAAVDVLASGGSAVNLPAGLRVTAVGRQAGVPGDSDGDSDSDSDSESGSDGVVPVTIAAASAGRLGLSDGDTLAVTGTEGTVRLRVVGAAAPGPDAALLEGAAVDGNSTLIVAVAAADLPRFSAPAVLGWQFTLPEDPSVHGLEDAAGRLAGLASDLERSAAGLAGATLTGDLAPVLSEVAGSQRRAVNLALDGAILVALLGAVACARLRKPLAQEVALPPGRLVPASVGAVGTVALAVVLPLVTGTRGNLPPLSVAPAVALSVASLLLAATLPRVFHRPRGGHPRPGSAASGRAGLRWSAAVFAVVLATGAGLLGSAAVGSADATARSTASLATGGDVQVLVPAGSDDEAAALAVPDGAASSRVLRTALDLRGTAGELVAVDAASLSAVLPREDGLDADRLGDALRATIPAPEPALDLRPAARQVRLQLATEPFGTPAAGSQRALRVAVAAWVEREDGALTKVPAGTLSLTAGQTQQHSLSFTVPEGVRAEAVAALDFVVASPEGSPTPGGGFFLTLLRSSSDAGIGSGESRFGAASDLVVVPSLPGTAEAGVVAPDDGAGFAVATLPRGSLTVRLAARVALDPVPVATTASAGAREGDALELLVNGTAVDAVVASVEPVLPGLVGGAGALADLRAVSYALLATEAGPAVPLEHWVSGPDPVPLAASLRAAAPPGSSIATAAVDPLGAPLAPLAWLLLVPCLLAAAGVLLPATPPVARTARAAEDPGPDGAPDPTVGAGLSGAAVAVGGVVLGLAAGAVAAVTAVAGGGSAPSPTPSLDPGLLAATLLGSLGLVAFAFFRRGRAGTTPGGRIHGEGAGGVPSPVSAVVARTGG